MRYRCINPKCPAQFAAAVGAGEPEPPVFREVRLATYEMDEDGTTIELLSWENSGQPVTCAYCNQPAKVIA